MSAAQGAPRLADAGLLALRLYAGFELAWYAVIKIGAPANFLKSLREYHVLPESMPWLLNGLAVVLPWLELLGAAALLLGVLRRGVPAVLTLMLAVFTAAVAWRAHELQLAQGLSSYCSVAFDCGCGAGTVRICPKLLENGLLLVACALLLTVGPGRYTLAWLLRRERA